MFKGAEQAEAGVRVGGVGYRLDNPTHQRGTNFPRVQPAGLIWTRLRDLHGWSHRPLQPLIPPLSENPTLSPPGRNSPQRAGSHSPSPRAQLPRCSVLGAHRGPGLQELEAALGARLVPQPWRSEPRPLLGTFGSQKSPLIQRGRAQRMALSPVPQNCPVSPAAAQMPSGAVSGQEPVLSLRRARSWLSSRVVGRGWGQPEVTRRRQRARVSRGELPLSNGTTVVQFGSEEVAWTPSASPLAALGTGMLTH